MNRPERLKTDIPPLDHAMRASLLQADRGMRLADVTLGVTRLLAEDRRASTWEQFWAIGDAASRRLERLQRGWIESWFEWLHYASQVDGARTVTKLAERELNVVNQASQLISEQTVSLLSLYENIEVDVLYWVTERSASEPAATATQP